MKCTICGRTALYKNDKKHYCREHRTVAVKDMTAKMIKTEQRRAVRRAAEIVSPGGTFIGETRRGKRWRD